MRTSTVTAGVVAALVLAANPLLSGGAHAEDPFFADEGAPYNDRPYAEEYVYESETYEEVSPRRHEHAAHPPRYSYKDDPPARTAGSIKDGYPVPMPPPAYGESAPPAPRASKPVRRTACLDRWELEERLRDDGWADIYAKITRRGVTRISARRIDTGRPFSLRVDRCSGELISARPRLWAYGGHRHRPDARRWASGWHD